MNVRQRKIVRFVFTIYDTQQFFEPMLLKDRPFIEYFPFNFQTFQKKLF